jgi:hypothetical protein
MKTSKSEQIRAEQVSAAVDRGNGEPVEPEDAALLATAERLARLPSLLGPVDPALEQQVMRHVRAGGWEARQRSRFRPGWAAAGLAAVLLVALLLTPLGETALASFMAVFHLGRTEVSITPVGSDLTAMVATQAGTIATVVPQSTAVQQSLTLEQAQAKLPFSLPQPAYLPPGTQLRHVNSYSYPELPPWVPQPLFAELVYGDGPGTEFSLHVYPIVLGEQASISGLNLQASPIQDVQDVDVNGQPGVLLQLGPERGQATWQEVVWERGDLMLALSSSDLSEADLLRIARSVP